MIILSSTYSFPVHYNYMSVLLLRQGSLSYEEFLLVTVFMAFKVPEFRNVMTFKVYLCRVKRVHPHAGWTGYEGVFVTVSDAVRSMCLKVLNPISGRQMKLESELGPATSMSR